MTIDPNVPHLAEPGDSNTVCTICGRWESNGIHDVPPEAGAEDAFNTDYDDGFRAGFHAGALQAACGICSPGSPA